MRLPITLVEAYRLYCAGDWMEVEQLEARIRGEEEVNDAMRRGTAFHSAIEHPDYHYDSMSDAYCANGWTFWGVAPVLDMLPAGRVNEAKAAADVAGVTLVGRADAMHGLDVYEAKCTERVQVDRYMDSFQWRAYLHAFGAARVTYVLAEAKPVDEQSATIKSVTPLTLYRYPDLERDVRHLVEECAAFIERRGLAAYVADKEDSHDAA